MIPSAIFPGLVLNPASSNSGAIYPFEKAVSLPSLSFEGHSEFSFANFPN